MMLTHGQSLFGVVGVKHETWGEAPHGFVVLKDINGVAQFLLIPTARISGIEDPAILASDAVNYWAPAWQARSFVEDRLHKTLPRNAVALAINWMQGRA